MNLPNYFFADLPQEATVTPTILADACETLRRNRQTYLAGRSPASLITLLAQVAAEWLNPEFPFRKMALEQGPAELGFSSETIAVGLDRFFRQLTPQNLERLIEQDLGSSKRLEQMTATDPESRSNRAAIATGPALLVHITAGNIPTPTLHSIMLGVLLRSAQLIKVASGTALIPRLFAHSLYQADRKLGSCLELANWPGGNVPLERVLFTAADCITATGNDKTLASIRARIPIGKQFLAYGQKISIAYVASGAFTAGSAPDLFRNVAEDVAAWDQLGCLSPHVVYVQNGGAVGGIHFAEKIAEELERLEKVRPRAKLEAAAAAEIASRRALYEIRAAHSEDTTRMWRSPGSTAWTVVYESEPRFQLSCLNRFIYIKPVKDLDEALQNVDAVRGQLSTLGLAAPAEQAKELALTASRWGVTRVCPVGRMQDPPLLWRHDGRPSLGDLVTWTDWELSEG